MDNNQSQDKQYEQQRLDHVIDQIHQREGKLKKTIKRAQAEEKNLNKHFYDDVKLDYGNVSTTMETALSIRQQQQLLQERNNDWQHANQRLDVLKRLEVNPYFARVDFYEKGEPKSETIYIGLGSFSNEKDQFLIYDWRAPISSIYYDGQLGDVTYDSPDGVQEVNLTLKRQFIIKAGKIENMFDTQETIGDQMLLEVLNEKSSTQMKTIVTTIQREQNQIIRDTKADLLFVQGAAGSGKTSAILQRIAYLLYRYRGNLSSDQVIMFSPNQLFNDYIENVLPELGEQNMVQMTYWQFLARRIPGLSVQNLFQQFEVAKTATQKKIDVFKNSTNFFDILTRYTKHLEKGGVQFKDIRFRHKPFYEKDKIKDIYYSFNENYHLANRIDATKEQLIKSLTHRIDSESRKAWVQDLIQSMPQEKLVALYDRPDQEFDSSDKEMRFLSRKLVTRELKKVSKAIYRNHFINIRAQYLHFLKNVPKLANLKTFGITAEEWQDSVTTVKNHFKEKQITMADASAYLYLYDILTGRRSENDMRYVFIDEIQDYTPFQLAYLKYNFPRAKFTMLGDLNQAILVDDKSHHLLDDLSKLFDPDKTRVVQLTRSYRSTAQITEYTRNILRSGQQIEPFDRQGPLPKLYQRSDQASLYQTLEKVLAQDNQEKLSTAIITKSLDEAQQLFKQLKQDEVKATLIASENQRLVSGVIVVPSYLAKGLEFDVVVMWGASKQNYCAEDERQLVYTIASRAMHSLHIMYQGEVSPLLAEIDPKLYENV